MVEILPISLLYLQRLLAGRRLTARDELCLLHCQRALRLYITRYVAKNISQSTTDFFNTDCAFLALGVSDFH